MSAPCALFTSCSARKPEELVKLVLDVAELTDGTEVLDGVHAYPWQIDNKYYTAEIQLCSTQKRTIGNQEFADNVQAFVVHFDASQMSSFELVKAWLPYVELLEPGVQILVTDSCSSTHAVSRVMAQSWCVDNGFELVELHPEENSDDEEDDFLETTGVKRIVQALHAHTWPNLQMKDRPAVHGAYYSQLLREAASLAQDSHPDEPPPLQSQSDPTPQAPQAPPPPEAPSESAPLPQAASGEASGSQVAEPQAERGEADSTSPQDSTPAAPQQPAQNGSLLVADDDMALLAALGNEDPGDESFEHMFERLRLMKEKAMSLPEGERQKYAEKVVMSFWRALGGDEEEIADLDD